MALNGTQNIILSEITKKLGNKRGKALVKALAQMNEVINQPKSSKKKGK